MAAIASTDALVSVGPYQLLEEIGRDSDIKFFKGCHRETGQLVAVKVVPPPYSADQVLVTRFEQEFRTSNALQHANIVRALDFGRVGSIVYLAAEFVEGTDLGTRIEHEGPLPEVEAVRIIVQAAQGLHHAHKHGIIHRNIKPANILLPTRGQAKLADLGLMKNLEADLDLTCRHIALGTPCYMAPEQLLDAKRAGVRCDIYGLGATLYEAVTGQPPFQSRTVAAVLKKKQANDVTAPRKLVPTVSEHVERAILQALWVDPDVRPSNCLGFVKMLTAGTPTSAKSNAARRGRKERLERPDDERRVSVRYACDVNTACKRSISIHPKDEHEDTWEATVCDLSVRGAGLLASRRFEVGALLVVQLEPTGSTGSATKEMRVVRVEKARSGSWFVAGRFTQPLSKEELRRLL